MSFTIVETADMFVNTEEELKVWSYNIIPGTILLFAIGTFRLRKPLTVKFHKEGRWFFAENEVLVITGVGETIDQAIEDFRTHVLYFVNYYKNLSENNLIGDAIRLKKIFNNLLEAE